ncbi:MAG: intradiol ring-cleavage dioxygenase [Myxococcaceae bacterium]|nr:intradiol ring-cleavage dioxygenase [Myxococcaceae bacterium]
MSDDHRHDAGLQADLRQLVRLASRRELLRYAAGAGVLSLLGCGTGTQSGGCQVVPEETQGPYPGDGSNGPNALGLSGIVRSDIRSSLGGLSGTAAGVPLTITLDLVNVNASCGSPLAGYAVYLWHCDRDGKYSMYDLTSQNYLRGVQESDANGRLSFTTIFPGCYSGRMPHAHFEVYPSAAKATSSANKVKTSQLAFPTDVCDAVYATAGYEQSVSNFKKTSFSQDMVFSDGTALQLTSVSGSVADGYTATLQVALSA